MPPSIKSGIRTLTTRGVATARNSIPPALQDRLPANWLRLARRLLAAGQSPVESLDARLWGGFSQSALADLQRIAADGKAQHGLRAEALRTIGSWYAANRNFSRALTLMEEAATLDPAIAGKRQHYALRSLYLCHLHRPQEARAILEQHRQNLPNSSLDLLLANTWNPACGGDGGNAQRMLDCINSIYRRHGLCSIAPADSSLPLSIENLVGVTNERIDRPDLAVTVIVPVYNAEDTVLTALRSLAQQTWRALRVIVVDDCSTDATADIVASFCAGDARFSLLRNEVNSGSYGSRNHALQFVDTPFVTVHDADDWSHPQKIQKQVESLLRTGAPYNYTMWVRTTPELMFVFEGKPQRRILGPNHSSGLFRTDAVIKAGGWDHVRISADTELFWRIEALNGRTRDDSRSRRILNDCPLAFGRLLATSLTQVGPTHTLTMFHGVRREYREASTFWHMHGMKPGRQQAPFFPAPSMIRIARSRPEPVDLFIVADFMAGTFASRTALDQALAASRHGLRTAILQYRGYHLDPTIPLHKTVRRLAGEAGLRIVAPGEEVSARLALVGEAGLLQHQLDRFPTLATEHALISINQLADPRAISGFSHYQPAEVMNRGVADLMPAVQWAPLSPLAKSKALDTGAYSPLAPTFWPLLPAVEPTASVTARQDNFAVGYFRTEDAPSVKGLHKAHPRIRFRDGTTQLRQWLGLDNMSYAASALTAYFGQLDCFIYFPQFPATELLGYPAALAMAHGVPVIAAADFKANFGAAALYCEPDMVWDLLSTLRSNPKLQAEQAAAGRAFAVETLSVSAYLARLEAYGLHSEGAIETIEQ